MNRLNFAVHVTGMVNNALHYGSYFQPIETFIEAFVNIVKHFQTFYLKLKMDGDFFFKLAYSLKGDIKYSVLYCLYINKLKI